MFSCQRSSWEETTYDSIIDKWLLDKNDVIIEFDDYISNKGYGKYTQPYLALVPGYNSVWSRKDNVITIWYDLYTDPDNRLSDNYYIIDINQKTCILQDTRTLVVYKLYRQR